MLNDALLHVRYRPLGDTAALHVDLPDDEVIDTSRDDHDLDQVVDWAHRSDGTVVLQGAQILHASALLALGEARLPWGAVAALRHAHQRAEPVSSDPSDIEIRCSLDSLSLPSAPPPRAVEHVSRLLSAPDHELSYEPPADPTVADARRELMECERQFPSHRFSGAQANLRMAVSLTQSDVQSRAEPGGPGRPDVQQSPLREQFPGTTKRSTS